MRDSTVFVDCARNGKVIRTYDFLCPAALGPTVPPSHEHFVREAKDNLSIEGLANPPYDGFTFKVRWR